MADQIEEFLKECGLDDWQRQTLPSDASRRCYTRLIKGDARYMLMDSSRENESYKKFMVVQNILSRQGFSVPQVYFQKDACGLAVLEDFGTASFTVVLSEAPEEEEALYHAATDVLIKLHNMKSEELVEVDTAHFIERVKLVPDWYLTDLDSYVVDEFIYIWKDIIAQLNDTNRVMTLLDYHVDNLMWLPDRLKHKRCGLLDFQDAVMMPQGYDIMSLLRDDRRNIPGGLQRELIDKFIAETGVDHDDFLKNYYILAAHRHTKNLGIFARLMKRDKKRHYGTHIPRLLSYIDEETQQIDCLHPLNKWFKKYGKIS